MKDQPEALRLAYALETGRYLLSVERDATAAELRRLYASCEDYAQHKQRQDQRILVLCAQRDALLEACRAMLTFIERHAPRGLQPEPGSPVAMARAAIAAVEGEKE